MNWNEENIARLKKLSKEGKNARQIAEILGEGTTRNAVIGKLNRLKKTSKRKPAAGAAKGKPVFAKAPAAKTAASKDAAAKPVASSAKAPSAKAPGAMASGAKASDAAAGAQASGAAVPDAPAQEAPAPDEPAEADEEISEAQAAAAEEPIVEEEDSSPLFGGCKWPSGHPGEEQFGFCGNPRRDGLPYCEEHAKEAYQPIDRRRAARS